MYKLGIGQELGFNLLNAVSLLFPGTEDRLILTRSKILKFVNTCACVALGFQEVECSINGIM